MRSPAGFAPAMLAGCALLSALLVMTGSPDARAATPLEQTIQDFDAIRALDDDVSALQAQADALQQDIHAMQSALGEQQANAAALQGELDQTDRMAGETALHGPGVVVRLADAPRERIQEAGSFYDINWFLVHDRDVLRVVNLLKEAGAEAVSINGVRMVEGTAIHCAGPAIYVRDISLTPPFVISAIGDGDRLYAAILKGDNGRPVDIYQELQVFGVVFTVEKQEDIMIPGSKTTDAARRASHDR